MLCALRDEKAYLLLRGSHKLTESTELVVVVAVVMVLLLP